MTNGHVDPELLDGFHRQRRSLLAVSLALVAVQGVDPTLAKLEILGNTIDLDAPLRVGLLLWVAWAYFLVRYYQYFHDIEDHGIQEAYRVRLQRRVRAKALKKAAKYLSLDTSGLRRPKIRLDITGFSIQVSGPPPWTYAVKGTAHIDEPGSEGRGRMQMIENDRITLPEGEIWGPKLRAGLGIALHTRLLTEYGLPFVIAGIPVAQRTAIWNQRLAAVS